MRIYLVTDEGLLLGKDLYRTVEAAVKGGVEHGTVTGKRVVNPRIY